MSTITGSNADRSTVLITGGSKGIGLELAKQFAMRGCNLVLAARSETDLEHTAKQLESENGCRVSICPLDLTADGGVNELYRQVGEMGIQVDILVNNAGAGDVGPFAESDLNRQLAMLQLNIVVLTALTRLFLPGMIERGNGRILNVASLAAYFSGGANWASYVASKHYVLAFTRGLASELSGTGVRITALCPGPTATGFVGEAGAGDMPIYRWMPKLSPSKVAEAGYRAAMAGRTTATPGLLNKLFAFLGELPPRTVTQSVFGFLSRNPSPGSTGSRRVS
ncbi:MAG: SDR family oxidoreductase [Candidatus Thiodiazotropha sp. (ex Ctena orbiculata)]|nr:SDR family oxidoreductase [Candidatus Thiodiazotropha taylori]MBT3035698.1 SDR family oxidoreductase [Candidatus Thiodiazotropha taylori]